MVPCDKDISSASAQDSRVADVINPRDGAPNEQTHTEPKQTSPSNLALTLHPDQEKNDLPARAHQGFDSFITPEKLLSASVKVAHAFSQGQEGGTPPTKGEKPSEDGFNWRKYGQKNVRGNEFVRSYYKCTHPNCSVKKQVERSHEGHITDTVYFGQHDHPKPQPNAPMALSAVEGKPSPIAAEDRSGQTSDNIKAMELAPLQVVTGKDGVKCVASPKSRMREEVDNDGDPVSKKKKKDNRSVDVASPDKPSGEARHIVQTTSEADIVNDGYRWRKYGQKLVKGNPHPRSYYRCSSPGCPVKKHVERAHHEPKLVMTSYEGEHDHDVPAAGRTVIRNPVGSGSNDDAKIRSEEGDKLGTELNGKEQEKGAAEPEPAALSDSGPENRSTVEKQSVLNAAAVQS